MELTEERLVEFERHAQSESVSPSEVLALVAEVRRLRKLLDGEHHQPGAFDRMTDWAQQMEKERDEARGLAMEYLHLLRQADSEEIRKAGLEKDIELHPWLLGPEPAAATGVAKAVFGMTQFEG